MNVEKMTIMNDKEKNICKKIRNFLIDANLWSFWRKYIYYIATCEKGYKPSISLKNGKWYDYTSSYSVFDNSNFTNYLEYNYNFHFHGYISEIFRTYDYLNVKNLPKKDRKKWFFNRIQHD